MSKIKSITGLTQAEAAEWLGVSRDAVVKAEGGRRGNTRLALILLSELWPLLSTDERERVRDRIARDDL
jgi:predicted transcriptional regulator